MKISNETLQAGAEKLKFLTKLYAPRKRNEEVDKNREVDKMDTAIMAGLRKYEQGNLQDVWIEIDTYLSAYCRLQRDTYERVFLDSAWNVAKQLEEKAKANMVDEIRAWEEQEYGRDREDY